MVQAEAELPHAEIQEQTQGHDDGRHDVHPSMLEGACVCLHRDDWVVIELGENELVARVTEILDDPFHLVADALNLVVGLIAEEHLHGIRHTDQTMLTGIDRHFVGDAVEGNGVSAIVRIVDDDLLAEDMPLLA